MKTIYAVILCVLLMLVSACAQKVNDPVDVQAIKDTCVAWDKPWNAGNVEMVASFYTADAIAMGPNQPASVGRDAMLASSQRYFDQFKDENRTVVEDVRVSGDLAVARGTQETKTTPKAGGPFVQDKAKWITVFQRQPDESWKILWEIYNSDLPVADALPLGQEELALLQLERDWAAAIPKKDMAPLDKMLATEFQANYVGLVGNKNQFLASVKNDTSKIESMVVSDMKALVFGDTAIVHGLSIVKSSKAGKDTSSQERFTDVFVKREGRWQCVTGYSKKVG